MHSVSHSRRDADVQLMQLPWLIDIELPPAESNSTVEKEISRRKSKRSPRDQEDEPNIKSLVKRAKKVE